MEGEREEEEECTRCGKTSTLVDTQTRRWCSGCDTLAHESGEKDHTDQEHIEDVEEVQSSQPSDGDVTNGPRGEVDTESQQDVPLSDTETMPEQTPLARDPQEEAGGLPLSPTPTERQAILTEEDSLLSQVSSRLKQPSEPCWYCLMSLPLELRHKPCEQEESDSLSALPSGGKKVIYQTDPRAHFGVAWSSHSTTLPLWGSEGPNCMLRDQDVPDQTRSCPHCHLSMPPDALRWHEAKCLLFDHLKKNTESDE